MIICKGSLARLLLFGFSSEILVEKAGVVSLIMLLLILIPEGSRHHSDGQRQGGDGTSEAAGEGQHPRDASGQVAKGQGESANRDGDAARQDQQVVRALGQVKGN